MRLSECRPPDLPVLFLVFLCDFVDVLEEPVDEVECLVEHAGLCEEVFEEERKVVGDEGTGSEDVGPEKVLHDAVGGRNIGDLVLPQLVESEAPLQEVVEEIL